MAHDLNVYKNTKTTKNKQHKSIFNDEVYNATTTEFDSFPNVSNYVKDEINDDSEELRQKEEISIKEESNLLSTENSFEDDKMHWDTNDLDSLQVESNEGTENISVIKNGISRTYKRKIYPIERRCEICNKTFTFQRDLVKHAQQAHPNAKAFRCQYCPTLFSKLKSVTTHLKRCHANLAETMPCGYCNKSFFIKYQLERHRRTHTEYFKVEGKNEDVGNDRAMEVRGNIFKNQKGKIYPIENKCATCTKAFSFQKDLIKHAQQSHPVGKVFKCLYCSTIFSKLRSVRTHYNRRHSKMPKTLFCDYCGMSFFTKFLLERHRRSHTEHRPFSCRRCDKTYKYKRNLDVHMKTHSKNYTNDLKHYNIDEYCENDEDEYCNNDDQNLLTEDEYCKDDDPNLYTDNDFCENDDQNTLSQDEEESIQENTEITEIITIDDEAESDQNISNTYRNTYFIIDEFNTDSEYFEDDELPPEGEHNENRNEEIVAENPNFPLYKQNECGVCSKIFRSPPDVGRHISRFHPEIEFFKCPYCVDIFYSLNSLSQHISFKKHTPKPYVCKRCLKSFNQSSDLNRHLTIHTNKNSYTCNICLKSFKQDEHLKRHYENHMANTPMQKKHVCKHCSKSFDRKNYLDRHLYSHIDKRPFTCHICQKSFKQEYSLQAHQESMHNNLLKSLEFNCSFCPKNFSNEDSLKRHLSKHTNINYYACSYCSKTWKRRYDWQRHELTHSSRKDLTCEYCLKSFDSNENLNSHVKLHTGEFKFLCTICEKAFRKKSHLMTHLKVHKYE